jgi:hypothetical protein
VKPKPITDEVTRKRVVKQAGVAFEELLLSSFSKADMARLQKLWKGLRALDEENGEIKAFLDEDKFHVDYVFAEFEVNLTMPGTSLTRVMVDLSIMKKSGLKVLPEHKRKGGAMVWCLGVGQIHDPKRFFYGHLPSEAIKNARKALRK